MHYDRVASSARQLEARAGPDLVTLQAVLEADLLYLLARVLAGGVMLGCDLPERVAGLDGVIVRLWLRRAGVGVESVDHGGGREQGAEPSSSVYAWVSHPGKITEGPFLPNGRLRPIR